MNASQKSQTSAEKLKSKLKMLVSAREQEQNAWRALEERYPSTQLTSFLCEFKMESFDAEHRLVNKIERTNSKWRNPQVAPHIVDGKIFIASTADDDASVLSLALKNPSESKLGMYSKHTLTLSH